MAVLFLLDGERVAIDLFPAIPAAAQRLPTELAIAHCAPLLLGEGHPVGDQFRVLAQHLAHLGGVPVQAQARLWLAARIWRVAVIPIGGVRGGALIPIRATGL